jgi:hypothetical protein
LREYSLQYRAQSRLQSSHSIRRCLDIAEPFSLRTDKSLDETLAETREFKKMKKSFVPEGRRNHSPAITAVILDNGQVLARCPTAEEFGRMAKMFNVSFELFYELWEVSRGPYDRGDLTAEEYGSSWQQKPILRSTTNRSRFSARSRLKSGPILIQGCLIG